MSDELTAEVVEAEKPQGETVETISREKYDELLANSRKWEGLAKSNKAAAEELEKLREAQKSEEQKRAEREAEKDAELARYRLRDQVSAWAKEIVKDSPVPADALRGSTREELEEHFEVLSALIKKDTPAPAVVPTIGASPSVGNVSLDDQIAAAEAAKDTALVAALKAQKLGAV